MPPNPPTPVVARFAAAEPAPIAFNAPVAPASAPAAPAAAPEIAFATPAAALSAPAAPVAPESAPVIAPAAPATLDTVPAMFFTAATVGPNPTDAAALTKPATCAGASLPVNAPTAVNAVCACCKLLTTDVACAETFLTRLVKFCAPG